MMNRKNLLSSFDSVSVADELTFYGFDVIESDSAFGYNVRKRAVQAFIDRYEIVKDTHIVRTEPGLLVGRLHDLIRPQRSGPPFSMAFEPGGRIDVEEATQA